MPDPDLTTHYGQPGLSTELLAALEAAFGDDLDAAALRGVDQFHLGGHATTAALLDGLDIGSDAHVLDVGCGIGGVPREIASRFACTVTGIDLIPEFVETAQLLSERVGLGAQTDFDVGNALDLPYEDARFDAAVIVHVGMNIEDKRALFVELARVVRPGATVAVYDIMRRSDAPLRYPVPWSADQSTDFVAPRDAYVEALEGAGLAIERSTDRTSLVHDAIERTKANPPPVNLRHLMGSGWPTMLGNVVAALDDHTIAPIELIATKD